MKKCGNPYNVHKTFLISLRSVDKPQAVNKMESDAQKVTNFTDTTCVFRFLGSRIFAASRVRSDHAVVGRATLTFFTRAIGSLA